jgi:hypothetical protein
MNINEQVNFLERTKMHFGAGTPDRLIKLIEHGE